MYKAYTCVRLRGYLKTYIQLAQEWHMEGKNVKGLSRDYWLKLAPQAGLEPATRWLTVMHSG